MLADASSPLSCAKSAASLSRKWQADLACVFRSAWSVTVAWGSGSRCILDVVRRNGAAPSVPGR